MKNNRSILFYLFCILTLPAYCFSENNKERKSSLPPDFFTVIPIHEFFPGDMPAIEIQIEEQTLSLGLDLGFEGEVSLLNQYVNQISSKKFLGTQIRNGSRGKERIANFHEIPNIKIGCLNKNQCIVQEETEESQNESCIRVNETPISYKPGKIGWRFFKTVNLFLDLTNSKIIICGIPESLKEEGHQIETFSKVPLLLDRGLVEFVANTPAGPLRCMLDTGATLNFLNKELTEGETFEEVLWNPEYISEVKSLKIGSEDFGPTTFHHLPIKLPIHIEAVLGMEFLYDKLVFIDFEEKFIYFANQPTDHSQSD